MRSKGLAHLPLALLFASTLAAQPAEERIDALIARMTLEEKLGQLSQYVPDQPEFGPAVTGGRVGSILNGSGAASANALQRRAIEGNRHKLPLLIGHDVIHGYRTIFPIPLAIASSWDPAMAELSATIGAREARAAGIRWTFAPMVDIARDPRWGRIAEGAGEDPHLGAAMAAASVRGFQSNGLLACAKHFAAYGAAEGGRDYATTDMSERTLREVYLPPFRAAVDAGVASIMTAFNALNGVPATGNDFLLDTILRKEWRFDGFVVSDWSSTAEMVAHGVAANKRDAASRAIRAGVDMAMVDHSFSELAGVVRSGQLDEGAVDNAVRRILRAKFAAGLFADPFTDERAEARAMLTRAHRDAALRAAERSIVLLKNDRSLLPLARKAQTIAVIGPLADSRDDMLGPWAAQGKAEETVSVLDGLQAAAGKETRILHARTAESAGTADLIIAVLGESRDMSGEAASRTSLDLPAGQQQLLEALVATARPVVLVVLSGRPLSISWAAEHVPAIVQGWFLGTEGGTALARVLFGDVNPGGKLPVTVPRNVGQVPIYHSMLPSGRPASADKFTSKYIDVPVTPLYPFGHGLSYTTFEYTDLSVSARAIKRDEVVRVAATVKNSGNRAGDEVVQLYINDPVARVSRPVRELRGFRRIALAPGESKRVEFTIGPEHLRFWDGAWVVEPGEFRVWIGPGSVGGLEGKFQVE